MRPFGSPLGLGTAPLGSLEEGPLWWGPQDRDGAVRTVVRAVDVGAAFIDTAPFYGWGRAERIVGEALAGRAERPPVLTKCATVPDADRRSREDAGPDAVRADVEASRRRLGLERIDVVQVHDVDEATPIEATWTALVELVEAGHIGGAGLSNHPVELMDRALAVGPIAVVQHQHSLLHRRAERDGVLDWCAAHGIPFLAWAPLASGFLTDVFDVERTHPTDLRRRLPWATTEGDATQRARSVAGAVAASHGTTMIAVALAWATRRPGAHAIVGARTEDEAELLGRPLPVLSTDELAELDELDQPGP